MGGRSGSLGKWVQEVRTKLGLNQFELAQRLRVHWVTISRWENDRGEPKLGCLKELARLYLDRALDVQKWTSEIPPVRVALFSHGILYDVPGMERIVRRFLLQGISLGYKVVYVHPEEETPEQVLERLGLDDNIPEKQFQFLKLQEVFFQRGRIVLGEVLWRTRRFTEQAMAQGFRRVRWIADMRPLANNPRHACDLIAYEYMSDSVFHSQHRSHGVGIYPLPGGDRALATCLLCRHPWVLTSQGPVRNPYYHDAVLCQARSLEGW